jgi:transposase
VDYYAAVDVSLELSSVCVVDSTGKIVREGKTASEPEALVKFFCDTGVTFTRIGLEAGPLSQWLHAGLAEAGYSAILIEITKFPTKPGRLIPLRGSPPSSVS